MAVYVDEVKDWGAVARAKGLRYTKWCHMVADSREELHTFAQSLGLLRRWFQDHAYRWHYDLTPGRRAQAVRMGAREINYRQLSTLMAMRRQGDNARRLTHDNIIDVFKWHGNCLLTHETRTPGSMVISGLSVMVDGVLVAAYIGDWVVRNEDGSFFVVSFRDPQ